MASSILKHNSHVDTGTASQDDEEKNSHKYDVTRIAEADVAAEAEEAEEANNLEFDFEVDQSIDGWSSPCNCSFCKGRTSPRQTNKKKRKTVDLYNGIDVTYQDYVDTCDDIAERRVRFKN